MKEKMDSLRDYSLIIAPILMTTAGLFSWAIRGQSGFGAIPGCVFAGTLWGITWFFFSKEDSSLKSRRYSMGWTVFAFVFGIGVSGMQGWGDIVSLIRSEIIVTHSREIISVDPLWGYFYVFLIGFHWAGTGAAFLAWSGSKNPINLKRFMQRVGAVAAGIAIFYGALLIFPQYLLPKYFELNNYDISIYNKLGDLYGEILQALIFSGAVFGALVYEIIQKDSFNIKTILIPSVFTGLSWMFLITLWELWVPPWASMNDIAFNWWRCWESTGGGAIGLGFGIVYIINNKKLRENDPNQRKLRYSKYPNAERMVGVYFALAFGLIYSTASSIKGNLHIMYPDIEVLDHTQIGWVIPIITIFITLWSIIAYNTIKNPYSPNDGKDNMQELGFIYLFVYILMRELGLQVTFALEPNFSETTFFLYYIALSLIDMILVIYLIKRKKKLIE